MSDDKTTTKAANLFSAKGMEDLVDITGRFCTQMMEETGSVYMMAVIVGTRDPETGAGWDEPQILQVVAAPDIANDGDAKEGFSKMLRELTDATQAIGTIFCSEAWIVHAMDEVSARRLKNHGGSISEHPDRREVIMMSVEHVEMGALSYACKVERPAEGEKAFPDGKRAHAEPWMCDSWGSKSSGRFVNLLNRKVH